MEWQIPEPLDIRPCQKPSELKPRQLNFYPLRLKKLPSWVDNATFEAFTLPEQQTSQSITQLPPKQSTTDPQSYSSFYSKYKNKERYTLIYEKGQERYIFNQKFTFEYISSNYSELDQWTPQQTNFKYQCPDNPKVNTARGSPQAKPTELVFDSRFQCGNLSKVYQVANTDEYHLMMQSDVNTLGYNQWFAFSINNFTEEARTLQIKIVNFMKSSSLYKKGMKPWCISEGSCVWRQIQDKCTYKKGNVKNCDTDFFSELSFTIHIRPGISMIAMLPIYSYSKLCSKIQKWKSIKGMRLYHKKVYSLINNILPILEYIPHFNEEFDSDGEQIKWYDTIVIFARTHPGEVWSSFLMQELIQTIVHYHKSNFVKFRYLILPMINPDGVIYGNFRCDFSGVDLNRVWIDPSRFTQPSIYNIKKILTKQFQSKKGKYFIDLHSHSKALNVFSYTSAETYLESRLVSDLIRLSDSNNIFDPIKSSIGLNKEFLTESQTTFLSSKQIPYSKKKSTARAFMSKLTQRGKSMTIEISFFGYQNKKSPSSQIKIFQSRDFNDLSWCLLKKLHDYMNFKEDVILAKKMLQPIYHNFYQNIYANANQSVTTVQSSPKKETKVIDEKCNDQSEDSDSQPQKYYTAETKKIIKSKHGQVYEYKPSEKAVMTRKGYLKHTQAMIKRIEVIKKDKSNSGLGNQGRRPKIHQGKQYQNLSLPFKNEQSQKKPSISDYVSKSHCDLPPSIQTTGDQHMVQSSTKLESSCFIGQKPNFMRKKLIIQSKRKQFRFSKEKRQQALGNKYLEPPTGHAISSIIEPVIIDIDETKKYEPTFGKFLTKNKRNASRRYKTMVREDVAVYKNELQKMHANAGREQGLKKMRLQAQTPSFLEDRMYSNDSSHIKFQSLQSQSKLGKCSQANLSRQQKKQSFKKSDQIERKKSKKSSGLEKIQNYKNKYLVERKKIVEMMKKQTRFYPEYQKDVVTAEEIEEIIQKRKRTNTDHEKSRNYFEDRNIFYESKMNTMKNSQPSGKPSQESVSLLKREFPFKKERQSCEKG